MTTETLAAANTPLELLSEKRGRRVWVKREDANPFGTHKDRRSAFIRHEYLQEEIAQRPDVLALVTSGNAGMSLRRMTNDLPISIRSIVPEWTPRHVRAALRKAGIEVRTTGREFLSSSAIVDTAKKTRDEKIWNVTDGYEFVYAKIVREIANVTEPDAIACPVGSGELLMGLHRGLTQLGMHTKLVGVNVKAGTGSKADKLEAWIRPYQAQIEELLRQGTLHQITLTDADVRRSMRTVPRGISSEPSASVVFTIVHCLHSFKNLILVNTGKGVI